MRPVNEENNAHLPESHLIIINISIYLMCGLVLAINYLPPLYALPCAIVRITMQ